MSGPTIVLITGVARGIGRGLAEAYLSRPNHTVIGTVRDTAAPNVDSLHSYTTAPGSRLILVQLESTNPEDYTELASTIKSEGITHLDIIIPNAGVASPAGTPATVDIDVVMNVFDVNTLSTLRLFQVTRDFLQKSPRKPKWASMSSGAASITCLEQFGTARVAPYALSKAGMNWITVAIHASEEWLTAFAIHPGLVQTDMGNKGAQMMGLKEAPNTLEEAVTKTMAAIDGATREGTSGKFLNIIDGTEVPW
ncbi:SDR family oxidoreductase [Aspergillus puulaauensis]|uniref:Uncharacterized protein n=1 Tax=Aspergillus puulaauensis TaxID=1220207 RepID=A0A7R7XVR9_9EURO|nr:uncharacterized protein APUU_60841S [Aspergillus puulaauensis]BCS27793.1 hypothetical protein APUU_60841S [Aspergillus puulaauensis]